MWGWMIAKEARERGRERRRSEERGENLALASSTAE